MTTNTQRGSANLLGMLGLACLVLVAWAAERLHRGGVAFLLAHAVLAFVTAVGWLVDRLPEPSPPSRWDSVRRPSSTCHHAPVPGD